MIPEILVVDDNLKAAESFARLIESQTGLGAVATDNPVEAIEIVRSNLIRVAVLDQRMPQKKGTELSREISQIDANTRLILLSGEAGAEEVGDAYSQGFVDYLHKGKIATLPGMVLQHYGDYVVDQATDNVLSSRTPLLKVRNKRHVSRSVVYKLVSSAELDYEFVPKDRWITIKEVNAGVTSKEVRKIEIEDRFTIEQRDEQNLKSNFGISVEELIGLKTSLDTAITSSYKTETYSSKRTSFEITKEYKLPNEPVNPKELHVIARHYQLAPVYSRFRCVISRNCECCSIGQTFSIVINKLTSKIATKQVDYLSDGSKREISTGINVMTEIASE